MILLWAGDQILLKIYHEAWQDITGKRSMQNLAVLLDILQFLTNFK